MARLPPSLAPNHIRCHRRSQRTHLPSARRHRQPTPTRSPLCCPRLSAAHAAPLRPMHPPHLSGPSQPLLAVSPPLRPCRPKPPTPCQAPDPWGPARRPCLGTHGGQFFGKLLYGLPPWCSCETLVELHDSRGLRSPRRAELPPFSGDSLGRCFFALLHAFVATPNAFMGGTGQPRIWSMSSRTSALPLRPSTASALTRHLPPQRSGSSPLPDPQEAMGPPLPPPCPASLSPPVGDLRPSQPAWCPPPRAKGPIQSSRR